MASSLGDRQGLWSVAAAMATRDEQDGAADAAGERRRLLYVAQCILEKAFHNQWQYH
jgi:hypothetical protein